MSERNKGRDISIDWVSLKYKGRRPYKLCTGHYPGLSSFRLKILALDPLLCDMLKILLK
jgi:hypothetical protein